MNTVLFDLDGTVLPLDMERFMKIYFDEMAVAFEDIIEKDQLVNNIWTATGAMVKNTEKRKNEEVFMETFKKLISGDLEVYMERFNEFYDKGFLRTKEAITENEYMRKSIALLKEKGYQLVIATNPLFPMRAIEHRISWAGFDVTDFSYVTSYENNHYCKPQLKYYEEVLSDINKEAKECMMVGNNALEDMIAGKLGMETYLIKDHLINDSDEEIACTYQGFYKDFYDFVGKLPAI